MAAAAAAAGGEQTPKKMIMVGDMHVGKTSLILRYTENTFGSGSVEDFKPKTVTVGKKTHLLHVWDTAGQELFGTITSSVYRKAKGIAYIYDVTREETFRNLKQWMDEVNRNYNEVQTNNFVIVANKCDLPAQVSPEEGQKFADQYKVPFIQASAKSGNGVEAIFTTLVKGLDTVKEDDGPQRLRGSSGTPNNKQKKTGGCVIL